MEPEAVCGPMQWTLLLIDGDIPEEFARAARCAGIAAEVIRCGEREAVLRLERDPRSVFVLSAARPYAEIERFVRWARPGRRSGLIVGPGDLQLAYLAYQLYAFADYIVPPFSEEKLTKTGDHLRLLSTGG